MIGYVFAVIALAYCMALSPVANAGDVSGTWSIYEQDKEAGTVTLLQDGWLLSGERRLLDGSTVRVQGRVVGEHVTLTYHYDYGDALRTCLPGVQQNQVPGLQEAVNLRVAMGGQVLEGELSKWQVWLHGDKVTKVINGGSDQALKYANPVAVRMVRSIRVSRELLRNGEFKQGLENWLGHVRYRPVSLADGIIIEREGVSFQRSVTDEYYGIMQTVNADVSGYNRAILSARVMLGDQRGKSDIPASLAVFVIYVDSEGNLHDKRIDTQGSNAAFRQIFSSTPSGAKLYSTKTPPAIWGVCQVDLLELLPRPCFIQYVGVEVGPETPIGSKIGHISVKWE